MNSKEELMREFIKIFPTAPDGVFEWCWEKMETSFSDKLKSNDRLWESEVGFQMNRVVKLEQQLISADAIVEAYKRYETDPNFRNAVLRIHAVSKYNNLK